MKHLALIALLAVAACDGSNDNDALGDTEQDVATPDAGTNDFGDDNRNGNKPELSGVLGVDAGAETTDFLDPKGRGCGAGPNC